MGVDPCEAYDNLVTAAWDSENGFRWDNLPDRAHAARSMWGLFDVRQAYALGAACPRDPNRIVHITRRGAQ